MTPAQLLSELAANPTSRKYLRADYPTPDAVTVYAGQVTTHFYSGVLAELNRADAAISIAQAGRGVERSLFVRRIALCSSRIAAMEDAVKKKAWELRLMMVLAADSISVHEADIQALLALGVADGVITAEERAGLFTLAGLAGDGTAGTRTGSRAEELWGAGVAVTLEDVAKTGWAG